MYNDLSNYVIMQGQKVSCRDCGKLYEITRFAGSTGLWCSEDIHEDYCRVFARWGA